MMTTRWIALMGVVAALLSLALLVAACDGDEQSGGGDDGAVPTATGSPEDGDGAEATTVDVALLEFDVDPSVDTAEAGTVTFKVINDGSIIHNFRVIKTDLEPDQLPLATTAVDEAQVDLLASTADLSPGDSEDVTLVLEPGSYVLICNIPTHYQQGTLAAFTVE